MTRVSLFMATFGKNDQLRNTLFSLSRQETKFEWEACIVDDCTPRSPEPIVRQFLPDAKFWRLPENVGTQLSQSKCWELKDSDSHIVVLMSADVVLVRRDGLQKLVEAVRPGKPVMAAVKNVRMPIEAWRDYDEKYWEKKWTGATEWFSKPFHRNLYFFFGAMKASDAELLEHRRCCCDRWLTHNMRDISMTCFGQPVPAIHQAHPSTPYPCSVYWCNIDCERRRMTEEEDTGAVLPRWKDKRR